MVNTLTVDNEAKQTIEALQNELQKTKEKLKAVEELECQSGKNILMIDPKIFFCDNHKHVPTKEVIYFLSLIYMSNFTIYTLWPNNLHAKLL